MESLTLVDVDALSDVDVLVESGTIQFMALVLFESLSLVDADALSDVDVLVESERLVLVDSLNDVLALLESLTLVDVDALSEVDVPVDPEKTRTCRAT